MFDLGTIPICDHGRDARTCWTCMEGIIDRLYWSVVILAATSESLRPAQDHVVELVKASLDSAEYMGYPHAGLPDILESP